MTIPKLHYISEGSSTKEHLENIQKACTYGAELVQLGFLKVSEKNLLKIAQEAREITAHFQTRLILSDHYKIAKEVKADGVLLSAMGTLPIEVRNYLYTWQMIGGSAHTLQDCEALLEKQADYICLGPFRAAASDHTAVTLGIQGYTAITNLLHSETPILAMGDITITDVAALLDAGISGLAVSEAITNDFNSIKVFHQLLKASSTQEQRHSFK
ncbi:thiamine phosphate synthase [Dokdonia ponticola]|uniref:Thiamine phosphate synthase n=1 Tax=Dokdonia ponticola TaxID=2041041 RepID=A0ABV9I1Q8_9FLAO